MSIREFILKDVRCFAGEQRVRLAPLTFLVGENSTGKSTVMGCFHAMLSESPKIFGDYDFNEPPYEFGTFTEIARKAEPSFELGYTYTPQGYNPIAVYFRFANIENNIVVTQVRNIFPNGEIVIMRSGKNTEQKLTEVMFPFNMEMKEKNVFIIQCDDPLYGMLSIDRILPSIYMYYSDISNSQEMQESTDTKTKKMLQAFIGFYEKNLIADEIVEHVREARKKRHMLSILSTLKYPSAQQAMIPLSPVRSEPKRTYDPINNTPTPEGRDVPTYLMQLKRQGQEQQIIQSLKKFGEASGMFSSIDVKAYGHSASEPFRLQVEVRGTESSILDVGYGVSQILPILVRIFSDEKQAAILLQQPEVHLHPRAQAELSSLFVASINERSQAFIIETHSDYMIDRARIEIRRGNIKPEDVSLVYFEPNGKNNSVDIHNISYDELGNLQNVPQGYRDFFMQEGDRLLGFDD